MTIDLQNNIIYGPINSRRLGLSLGINLLPRKFKVCPFNCVYCQYGFTNIVGLKPNFNKSILPNINEIEKAIEIGIKANPGVDYITFSGNGEPTAHPDFPSLVDIAISLRNKFNPSARTAILSNSATVSEPSIVKALNHLDCRFMKLDSGDETTFKRFNRPHKSITFESIIIGLAQMRDIVIQALFAGGEHGNSSKECIKSWIRAIGEIKPKECHIYSLDRPSPDNLLYKLSHSELANIMDKTESEINIPIHIF